jgi:hypothetical protein
MWLADYVMVCTITALSSHRDEVLLDFEELYLVRDIGSLR